ncbi:MAG: hypothetical protein AAFP84_15670 [Actinomycetota bacterium]
MRCHVCNAEVGENQQFCHLCGESLRGVTDPTEPLDLRTVFEQADADGGTVEAALAWAADDDDAAHADGDLADAGKVARADGAVAADAVADAVAVAADGAVAEDDAVDADDAVAVVADDVDVAELAARVEQPTQAVALGVEGGVPDPWAVRTGEHAASAPAIDPDATATMDAVAIGQTEQTGQPGQAAPPQPVPTELPAPTGPAVAIPDDVLTDDVATGHAVTDNVITDNVITDRMSAATAATIDAATTRTGTTRAATPPAGVTGAAGTSDVTGEIPYVFDGSVDADVLPPEPEPYRLRVTLVLAVLAVVSAVLAAFADVTDVRTDRVVPGIENRLRMLDDIGTNLAIAGFVGTASMLVGAVAHCLNQRWGAGVAGGAGLAVGGWAAIVIGLAEVPIRTAERITRDPNTPGPFVLTVTRDVGYWLVIALGVLGGLAFLASLVSAGTGGRPGLDPWTAALGALGGVVAAAGPLIPVGSSATNDVSFRSNFGVNDLPSAFFAGRLVQVAVLGVVVMFGFLLVRRYGLGFAAGGLTVPTVMWVSSLLDVGSAPIGIAVGNLGTTDIAPHGVTTVGMSLALVMLVVASVLAVIRRP